MPPSQSSFFFFFNDTATTEIYTLSLHDALPILRPEQQGFAVCPLGVGEAGLACRAVGHGLAQREQARLKSARNRTSGASDAAARVKLSRAVSASESPSAPGPAVDPARSFLPRPADSARLAG